MPGANHWALQRRVSHVYESDGREDRLLWRAYADGSFARLGDSDRVSPHVETQYAAHLRALAGDNIRDIAGVRRALLTGGLA